MTLAPGLLYFYLRFAMSRFDPLLLLFVSVPLLIAGLGCTGIGLRSLAKTGGKAARTVLLINRPKR